MHDPSSEKQELHKMNSGLKQKIREFEKSNSELTRKVDSFKEQEDKLADLFRSAPVGIGLVIDQIFREVNDMLCQITGYSHDELLGQSASMLYPTQEEFNRVGQEKCQISDTFSGTLETRWKRKDGRIIDVILSSTVFDPDNPSKGVTCTALDITDRGQANVALKENNHEYRRLFDNAGEGIYVVQDHKLVFFNPMVAMISGYSSEELKSKTVTDFIHPDDRDMVMDRYVRRMRGEDIPSRNSFRIIHRDDSIRWVELNVALINWKGKRAILNFITDITNRKQIENDLIEKTHFLERILESTPNLIYIYDLYERCNIFTNREIVKFLGYTSEQIQTFGSTLFQNILHPDDAPLVAKHHAKCAVARDHEVLEIEYRMKHADGQWHWLRSRDMIFSRNPEGKGQQILGTAEDITERKRAEESLQKSEERYRVLFEGSTQGLLAFDFETGRFSFANPSICRMLGYSEMELLQLGIVDVHPKDSLETIMMEFEFLRKGEKKLSSAIPCLRKDGTVFYADITATDTSTISECGHIVGFFEDVTERRRVEEESKLYAKELEDANTALRVFMGHRDHDQKMLEEKIRLNMEDLVVPYLKKLNETNLDVRQKNYLGVLEGNLNNVMSPYMLNLSAIYKNLTPQEIQIANLIRLGKKTKDIAELLCTSWHTVCTHRNNIRRKLKLRNSKANLRSYLLSLS